MTSELEEFRKSAKSTLANTIKTITISKKDHLIIGDEEEKPISQVTEELKVIDQNSQFILPPNITQEGKIFKQTV